MRPYQSPRHVILVGDLASASVPRRRENPAQRVGIGPTAQVNADVGTGETGKPGRRGEIRAGRDVEERVPGGAHPLRQRLQVTPGQPDVGAAFLRSGLGWHPAILPGSSLAGHHLPVFERTRGPHPSIAERKDAPCR